MKCATSVVHQADQACRRLISDTMKTARGQLLPSKVTINSHLYHLVPIETIPTILVSENQVPSEHMRTLAAQLNESKATFLHNLRTQFLQEAPFVQEDISVEDVVKRAVSVFDDNKKEILSRFIDNHELN